MCSLPGRAIEFRGTRSAEQVVLKQALRVDDLRAEIRGLLVTHRTRGGHNQTQEGNSHDQP